MDSFEKIQYVIATTLKVSPDKITKETSQGLGGLGFARSRKLDDEPGTNS